MYSSSKLNIELSDEGISVSIEARENLFKPFFRSKKYRREEGTGLGLSIVQRAAELHNLIKLKGQNLL